MNIQDFFAKLPHKIRNEVFTCLATCRNCRKVSTAMLLCDTWCDECVSYDKTIKLPSLWHGHVASLEEICNFLNIRSKYDKRVDGLKTKKVIIPTVSIDAGGGTGQLFPLQRRIFLSHVNSLHENENVVGVDATIRESPYVGCRYEIDITFTIESKSK